MFNKFLAFIFLLLCASSFAQKYDVNTSGTQSFKRHFSYSIEGGFVNDSPRLYIAGNENDFLAFNKVIKGNAISGTTCLNGRAPQLTGLSPDNLIMTDFVVLPGNFDYAAGTGMYMPQGPDSSAFAFLAIYERRTMSLLSMVYYDLSFPIDVVAKDAAGVRIKYSEKENAYYISGIMVDDVFVDMNFNEIQGHSKGFIMKIDQSLIQAQVLVFDPDVMPVGSPEICSVNDMEINADQTLIAFTGVNTENQFNGYIQPMVGIVDMDLNVQWCNTYEITNARYSGIDVEFGLKEQSMFVLLNSATTPFAVMELNPQGAIVQQPENYDFFIAGGSTAQPLQGAARAHIMHFTESEGLIITGNCFTLDGTTYKQDLFKYDIPVASDLTTGNTFFNSYSYEDVPLGSQIATTSWWAPENSLYRDGNLAIVGHYNNPPVYGYSFINVSGFDTTDSQCLRRGQVELKQLSTELLTANTYIDNCNPVSIGDTTLNFPPAPVQSCPGKSEKSTLIDETGTIIGSNWKYAGIDQGGIYAILNAETQTEYQINIYDITGRKVCSSSYRVEGQKYVYLKFNTQSQLYLLNVNDGSKSETIKVLGVH